MDNRPKAKAIRPQERPPFLPFSPSKRDLVLLASGIYPLYFHNHLDDKAKRKRDIAIYLDVSGSVNDDLPEIIGILRSLRNEMERIYLFSNKLEEVSFAELISQGKVKTTWGTDFDCVAESIVKEGYEKAVVITDGWASMKKENLAALKKKKVKTLTILLSRSNKEPDCFKELGPIVRLKDAVI